MAKAKQLVRCRNCRNCELLLYQRNGVIIADCLPRKEREVANAERVCELYTPTTQEKQITRLYEMF